MEYDLGQRAEKFFEESRILFNLSLFYRGDLDVSTGNRLELKEFIKVMENSHIECLEKSLDFSIESYKNFVIGSELQKMHNEMTGESNGRDLESTRKLEKQYKGLIISLSASVVQIKGLRKLRTPQNA